MKGCDELVAQNPVIQPTFESLPSKSMKSQSRLKNKQNRDTASSLHMIRKKRYAQGIVCDREFVWGVVAHVCIKALRPRQEDGKFKTSMGYIMSVTK